MVAGANTQTQAARTHAHIWPSLHALLERVSCLTRCLLDNLAAIIWCSASQRECGIFVCGCALLLAKLFAKNFVSYLVCSLDTFWLKLLFLSGVFSLPLLHCHPFTYCISLLGLFLPLSHSSHLHPVHILSLSGSHPNTCFFLLQPPILDF